MRPKNILLLLLSFQIASFLGFSRAASQEPSGARPTTQAGQRVEGIKPINTSPVVSPVQRNTNSGNEISPPSPTSPVVSASDMLIQGGDLLEITVYGAPDFNKQVRVAEKGDITLPLIGDVHVAGLSLHDAELLVQRRLTEGAFFADPQVSIFARESSTQGISVLGEVQKPGIYLLPGQHSLFDALSAAGGATPRAGNTITIMHRGRPNEAESVHLPPDLTLPPESNVAVLPGDTIVVSKAGIVYVVGDVKLPGGFIMENSNLTVLQAVAMAQGANTTAKLDNTLLIRRTPEGRQEIPVLLSKVMSAKSPDPKLQADDIIFVPRSTAKAGFKRGLDAALQTVVGMAIYRPY